MERGQYMIVEDASSNSYHEHVQATTTPGNEEIVEEIFCEPSLEDPLEEHFDQFGGGLDLEGFLGQAKIFNEQSLEYPTLEVQTEKGETTKISFPNSYSLPAKPFILDNHEEEEKEEQVEKIEPPQNSNLSNEKEVSTEAHSLVTIPLETQHEPQVSPFQCLEEPSYVEMFKESCTQDHKSRNRVPKMVL